MSANSEHREHVGINASFENASENNNALGVSNVIDEARHDIQDEVSELSLPETRFNRQPEIYHTSIKNVVLIMKDSLPLLVFKKLRKQGNLLLVDFHHLAQT